VGGTIVARAVPGVPHAELSPMMLVYPVAWSIGAIALALSGQPQDNYLAAVNQVCAHPNEALAATPPDQMTVRQVIDWVHADRRAMAALKTPAGAEGARAEILALEGGVAKALDGVVERAMSQPDPKAALRRELGTIDASRQRASARYAELGIPACVRHTA
jgi:hypothetical protein